MGPGLEASFARLGVRAAVGAAIAMPGGAVHSLGEWSTGVAWSTIKVPLAIAALRGDRSRAEPLLDKAITESDNPASEQLWSQLGDPTRAALLVQAVIEDAGDSATTVESRRLREGFTAFGQTRWSLAGQARFAARLTSLGDAAPVIDLMHRLVAAQRWGMAAKGYAAKGGWGPGTDGSYLVRQFGIVPVAPGRAGVALAAQANTFEDGVEALDTMTEWLLTHLPDLTE